MDTGTSLKSQIRGLVSMRTFNKANKGKVTILEENGEISIYKRKAPEY